MFPSKSTKTRMTKPDQHVCIVNVGLYRTGTTTLAEASKSLELRAYREFPALSKEQLKMILTDPGKAVLGWVNNGGLDELVQVARTHDLICDGWVPLLPLLPELELKSFVQKANQVDIQVIATTRNIESMMSSELQH